MYRNTIKLILLLVTAITMVQCRKKALDDYYGRPDTLEPGIYQVLEAKGNFKHFLAAADKAGYKSTLSGAGYWTVFAPHDSAFQVYFAANNISGIGALSEEACRKLVTYALVYNAFKQERISDYQSNTGWIENVAFKRRTANYTGVYDAKDTSGADIKAIASNRNNNGAQYYVIADNNNKYIPIFETNYMTGKALTAADYTYFYPGSSYSGFNVADAQVVE